MAANGGERNVDGGECTADATSSGNDGCHELYIILDLIEANLDQLSDNCYGVYDRIRQLEMDCIDLLHPMGDIISLERELKRLNEVESNYLDMLKKIENNE